MADILACKMFKASKRKDKIIAAMSDPINKELMMQLRDMVDYGALDLDDTTFKTYEDEAIQVGQSNKDSDDSDNHVLDIDLSDDMEVDNENSHLDDDVSLLGEDDSESADDVETSDGGDSSDEKGQVESSINMWSAIRVPIDEIRGTLNSREDTKGVNRILVRDSELWIYYGDKINLNNVMGDAIELLDSAGYSYLDFNRLARSDNAIVFQISEIPELKSVTGVSRHE